MNGTPPEVSVADARRRLVENPGFGPTGLCPALLPVGNGVVLDATLRQ